MEERDKAPPDWGFPFRLWVAVLLTVGLYVALMVERPDRARELMLPAVFAAGVLIGDLGKRLRPWELAVAILTLCSLWGWILADAILEGLWGSALFMVCLTVLAVVSYRLVTRVNRRRFGLRHRRG